MREPQAVIDNAERDLMDHPAAGAWRKLGAESAQPRRIELLRARKGGGAVYRLGGSALERGIIAKRCGLRAGENERFVYQEILPQLPVSTLQCYGLVVDDDPEFCWLFLEDAGDEKYSSQRAEHRILAGQWLGAMHVAAHRLSLSGRLSERKPTDYLQMLELGRDMIRTHLSHSFPPDDVKMLSAAVSHLDCLERHWDQIERLCEGMPRTLIHDDLATKNARVRNDRGIESLLVMDWESAGWGVPAADLAQFIGGVLTPDLAAYGSAVRACWPFELRDLRRFAEVGACFRMLNGLAWTNWGFYKDSADWYAAEMRWYERSLSEWIRAQRLQD